jgi:hypothetical protein
MTKLINPAEEEAKKAAAGQPHGLFYVDKLLNIKTDGYNVQVTVGWETPNGKYNAVATVAMPVNFAKEFAEALMESVRDAPSKRGAG